MPNLVEIQNGHVRGAVAAVGGAGQGVGSRNGARTDIYILHVRMRRYEAYERRYLRMYQASKVPSYLRMSKAGFRLEFIRGSTFKAA